MFSFQNVGKLFLHFLNIKKIVCKSPFSGIVDGIVRGHKCGSLFRWLTKTWRSSWSCRIITLQFNQKPVQFSLRWAVFNVAYNQKRGVSSFKLSWFGSRLVLHQAVHTMPKQLARDKTSLIILENIFYNLHLPYNLKPSCVKLGVKQVWHSSVQLKMSHFQTSV